VERHLGGPVTKILLDNCYHMITVDLQYRRVIELSAEFVELHTASVDASALWRGRLPASGSEASLEPATSF